MLIERNEYLGRSSTATFCSDAMASLPTRFSRICNALQHHDCIDKKACPCRTTSGEEWMKDRASVENRVCSATEAQQYLVCIATESWSCGRGHTASDHIATITMRTRDSIVIALLQKLAVGRPLIPSTNFINLKALLCILILVNIYKIYSISYLFKIVLY